MGHWAGDPECKFPNNKGNGKGSKGAHLATIDTSSPPSDDGTDDGVYVSSQHVSRNTYAAQGVGPKARSGRMSPEARSAALASALAARQSGPMEMSGGDRKFHYGQHKGDTYTEVANKPDYVKWALQQSDPPDQIKDFLTWFNRYYILQDGVVAVRTTLGLPEGRYEPRIKRKGTSRVPPNPPLERPCADGCCWGFTGTGRSLRSLH